MAQSDRERNGYLNGLADVALRKRPNAVAVVFTWPKEANLGTRMRQLCEARLCEIRAAAFASHLDAGLHCDMELFAGRESIVVEWKRTEAERG